MFGDALALWFIMIGTTVVLAVAALMFLIAWHLVARQESLFDEADGEVSHREL